MCLYFAAEIIIAVRYMLYSVALYQTTEVMVLVGSGVLDDAR